MNNSWEEIFMENCGPEKLEFLSLCSAVLLWPLTIFNCASIVAFFNRRTSFHPLFSFCFLTFLLFYCIASSILAIRNTIFMTSGHNFEETPASITDVIIMYSEKLYMAFSFYIPPIITIATLERFLATLFASWYEKSRLWGILALSVILVSVLVYIEFANRHVLMATIPTRNIQLFFAIVCTFSTILLFLANRSKSKTGRAKSALTERYQVTENIKALRILLPVVCLDTAIQILFLGTDIILNVGQVLNLNNCYDDNSYLTKFLIFRMIGFVTQYTIPVIVILHFTKLPTCSEIRRAPIKRSSPVSPCSEINSISVVTIRNVLGATVSGDEYGQPGQDAHFKSLSSLWI